MNNRLPELISLACAVFLLGGCAVFGRDASNAAGERWLTIGINQFGEGQYADATMSLQASLQLPLTAQQQVQAHKYLAFIHCVSGKERPCRDEFGKALDVNPALELAPAEVGHPIWGPVFHSVKAKRAEAKK